MQRQLAHCQSLIKSSPPAARILAAILPGARSQLLAHSKQVFEQNTRNFVRKNFPVTPPHASCPAFAISKNLKA
jgi:hypothetical protein